ncbi:MAG: type Z 30S ribosomal protein S14 [Acidobacteriota bacterium]
MARTSSIAKTRRRPRFEVRRHNRCQLCGRPRGFLRKFAMCRICVRKLALQGLLPGVNKASW